MNDRDILSRRCKASLDAHRRRARKDRQALNYDLADLKTLVTASDRCAYCGALLTVESFSIDHQSPTCRTGDYRYHNLAVCCTPCNERKGSLTAAEYRELLALVNGWHPCASADLLARLRAGGRRRAGR